MNTVFLDSDFFSFSTAAISETCFNQLWLCSRWYNAYQYKFYAFLCKLYFIQLLHFTLPTSMISFFNSFPQHWRESYIFYVLLIKLYFLSNFTLYNDTFYFNYFNGSTLPYASSMFLIYNLFPACYIDFDICAHYLIISKPRCVTLLRTTVKYHFP